MSLTDMILAIRKAGMSSADISRWAKAKGRKFGKDAITSIVHRQAKTARKDIEETIRELYNRLCC